MQKFLKQVTINFTDSGDFNGITATHINVEKDAGGKIIETMWGIPKPVSADDFATIAEFIGDDFQKIALEHSAKNSEIELLKEQVYKACLEVERLTKLLEETQALLISEREAHAKEMKNQVELFDMQQQINGEGNQ